MNEINKRIQKIIHEFADSRERFCEQSTINPNHLKQIFRMQREITYDHLLKICKCYPSLNVQWLMFGNGKMRNTPDSNLYKINISISKTNKITLRIYRSDEFSYRESGKLLKRKCEYYQSKYNISEDRALIVAGYYFTLQMKANDYIAAYALLVEARKQYKEKCSYNKIHATISYHYAFYFHQSQNRIVINAKTICTHFKKQNVHFIATRTHRKHKRQPLNGCLFFYTFNSNFADSPANNSFVASILFS